MYLLTPLYFTPQCVYRILKDNLWCQILLLRSLCFEYRSELPLVASGVSSTRLPFASIGMEMATFDNFWDFSSGLARMLIAKLAIHLNAYPASSAAVTSYLEPPKGIPVKKGCVWQAMRSLYVLKQAARNWNRLIKDELINWGFIQSK